MSGSILSRLKLWARALKREVVALHLTIRDSRTPLIAKLAAAAVVAYALSPIDLVPDFIPVLGQIDDLILVPLGLWLVMKLIPADVLADARAKAREDERLPASRAAAVVIAGLWIASLAFVAWLAWRRM